MHCNGGGLKDRHSQFAPPPAHYGQEVQEKIKAGSPEVRFRSRLASHNEQEMKKRPGKSPAA
jgi:hypothetical protein